MKRLMAAIGVDFRSWHQLRYPDQRAHLCKNLRFE
jgi:hypothetical protein